MIFSSCFVCCLLLIYGIHFCVLGAMFAKKNKNNCNYLDFIRFWSKKRGKSV